MSMFDHDQLYNAQGVARTKSIFHDFAGKSKETLLSLKTEEHGYPNLSKLYVKFCIDDPSEATFAEEVFGDITFWAKLKESPCVRDLLPDWEHEATVKRKSKAFKHILKEIEDDGRNGYNAAKYLIDEPWKPKTKASKAARAKSSAQAVPSHVVELTEYIKNR